MLIIVLNYIFKKNYYKNCHGAFFTGTKLKRSHFRWFFAPWEAPKEYDRKKNVILQGFKQIFSKIKIKYNRESHLPAASAMIPSKCKSQVVLSDRMIRNIRQSVSGTLPPQPLKIWTLVQNQHRAPGSEKIAGFYFAMP